MKKIFLFATIIVFFVATGLILQSFTGNAQKIESKKIEISSFTELIVKVPFNVIFTQGDASTLTIDADAATLQIIEVVQKGDELTIGINDNQNKNVKSSEDVKIYLSTPALKKINLAGSGSFSSTNSLISKETITTSVAGSGNIDILILSAALKGDIAGSGNITIKGTTKNVTFSIAGSGNMMLLDLIAEDVTGEIAGSGSAKVHANNSLEASIAGSGDLTYSGDPKKVTKNINGSGSVKEN